jgi:hypothetical protein
MAQTPSPTEADLVAAHKNAIHQLAVSQRMAVAVPLLLLIGLVAMVWIKMNYFIKIGAPQTLGLIIQKSPRAIVPLARTSIEAFNRLAPVYGDAIKRAFDRDHDKIATIVNQQIKGFSDYAANTNVVIQERMKETTTRLAVTVANRLTSGMTDKEAEEFTHAAAGALYAKLGFEIQNRWSEEMALVGRLGDKLNTIAQNDSEAKDAEPSIVVGAGLELVGRKIQGLN